MSKLRDAAQQALEALVQIHPGNMTPMAEEAWNKALVMLGAALAEQPAEQEPVAWVDVADAEHGPYEFHGIEKLPAGKHHLFAAPPAAAVPSLASVLDAYEQQTKALPCQHEIPERGCSTYNWQMAVVRDLRAMLAAAIRAMKEQT